MKNILVLVISIFLMPQDLLSQNIGSKTELINYFDNQQSLDPIEGLWTLNVVRTLYSYDKIIGQELEEVRSEWGIVRENKLRFKVLDIGESEGEPNSSNFYAYFESSALEGIYTYKIHFKNPNWIAKTNAELSNGLILEYDYFVSEVYMQANYKSKYKRGMRLHWKFVWTKKYPQILQPNYSEAASEWKGNGTGFFISKNGHIATNYHVVKDSKYIEIEFVRNGEKLSFPSIVVQSDKQNDISIIKINSSKFKPFAKIPFNFKTDISDVATNVFALGYPMALSLMGTEIKFTDGRISSKTGMQGDITSYQISVPIQPGNSGGPLFDFDGNLIGITSSGVNRELDITENVNYAIKSSYLKNLVDVLDYKLILPDDKSIANRALTEKIKILSDYVVLIKIR